MMIFVGANIQAQREEDTRHVPPHNGGLKQKLLLKTRPLPPLIKLPPTTAVSIFY